MNILVTGGAGFIGSHLCDELVKQNHVICLDNFITGRESNIDHLAQDPNFEFIKHDIREPLDLSKYRELRKFQVAFQGIQEIYHAACPASPLVYFKLPIETLLTSAYGTKNTLDLARKHKAKFLFFSSVAVYGQPTRESLGIFKEDYLGAVDPIGPRSSYAEGKRFAESLVVNYGLKYNLDVKIVRIFNTYGPRMKLEDGRLVPDLVKAALANEPIGIYGDKEKTTTLCYVSDLISGLKKMMASKERGPINLGSDQEIKVIEVAQKIIRLSESSSQIVFKEPPAWAALGQAIPDLALAREKLGFLSLVSLEDGLKKTITEMRAGKVVEFGEEVR